MNNKGKTNKKQFKTKKNFKKDFKEEKSKTDDLTGNNDYKWYSLNKELVEMSCRVPFGRPAGNSITLRNIQYFNGTGTASDNVQIVPGILSFAMVPSIGCSGTGTQSIDVAAKSIYSWVRHANSGHSNYDSPDLMIYLLACANVYAAAGYMLKVYSCINKYDPTNRYYPDAILHALGVNPTFAKENIADLRYFMAQWWKKAASLFTPKKLPLFEKAFWMYTQIYEEDKTGKSGLYQYIPHGFHKYNPTKYTTGGCLEYVTLPTFNSMAAFRTYFSDLLDVLINDEDMGIMSGDIKKAFDNDVWSLGEFPYDATIQPVHDSFVLQQMHNTRGMSITSSTAVLDIVQDNVTNELLFFPAFKANQNYDDVIYDMSDAEHLLDIDSAVPSVEEVMEATQYMNYVARKGSGALPSRIATFATITGAVFDPESYVLLNASDFTCTYIKITSINPANGQPTTQNYIQVDGESIMSNTMTKDYLWNLCARLSSFEFAPMVALSSTGLPLISLHNYTLITSTQLANIHDAAWLSLLCIPAQQHLK